MLPQFPAPGRIVEYREAGSLVSALVLKEDKGKLLCATGDSKSFHIPAARVLNVVDPPASIRSTPGSTQDILRAHGHAVEEARASLDMGTLWEILEPEPSARTLDELTDLSFGRITGRFRSAVLRALIEDNLHFRQKKNVWEPRSRDEIETVQGQRTAEAARKKARQGFLDTARQRLHSGAPDPPWPDGTEEFLDLIQEAAFWGEQSSRLRDALALLEEIGFDRSGLPHVAAFSFLRAVGVFHEDENLFVRRNRVRTAFAEEVLDAPVPAVEDVVAGASRLDLTSLPAVTIDAATTIEIDDALTVEERSGLVRVGVHIADPSEFVAAGGPIDREALDRATTHYLPENQILLLPPVISADSASLVQGAVRPALSFLFDFDAEGTLVSSAIVESRIRVAHRMTYEEVDALLAGGPGCAGGVGPAVASGIGSLHAVAQRLHQGRISRGALHLKAPDLVVLVLPGGDIVVKVVDTDTKSHLLVSEFMILVNITAAAFFRDRGIPAIYRRQSPPDSQGGEQAPPPAAYDAVAVHALRRRMRRTEIGLEPGLHWTLGASAYVQVTSPLRRYQDLALQRQIKSILRTGKPAYTAEELSRVAAGADEVERIARDVERLSREYWLLKYFKRLEGSRTPATVLRLAPRSAWVELDEYLYSTTIPRKPRYEEGDRFLVKIVSSEPRVPSLKVAEN